MIAKGTLMRWFGASTISLAVCSAQPTTPTPPKSTVYVNPRSGSDDPRVGLKGGLYDAGQAASGLELMVSVPKPPGFAPGNAYTSPAPPPPPPAPGDAPRPPANQYGSTNSDLAFSGNHLFVGNYNGINFYDIDNPGKAKLRASLVCPGGQGGDVSVYGHLLFMSAEAVNGRKDCGTQGIPLPAGYTPPPPPPPPEPAKPGETPARPPRVPPPPSPDRFRGVRIFDISDMGNPKQVAIVQSCRGSHTHTLVIDPKDHDNVYIYISGTGAVRQAEELAGCVGGDPAAHPDTSLFSIDIIQVPLAHPELAKIVSSPRIFADDKTGAINGLWKGGTHGEGTQKTSETDKYHATSPCIRATFAAGGLLRVPVTESCWISRTRRIPYASPQSAIPITPSGTRPISITPAQSVFCLLDEWGGGGQLPLPRNRSDGIGARTLSSLCRKAS